MNRAMAPFISETYNLSSTEKGVMLSVPIFAGALMRFPLGVLAQYIGRTNATLVEMGLIMVALLFGYFLVDSYSSLLAMGVLLLLPGPLQRSGDGSGGRWQRGHRCIGAGGSGAGTAFRLAERLWHCRYRHAAAAARQSAARFLPFSHMQRLQKAIN